MDNSHEMSNDQYTESSISVEPRVDDYLGLSPNLFDSILQGYPNSEEDLQKALDNLLHIHDFGSSSVQETPSFEEDAQCIDKALQDNEALQAKIKELLNGIDQHLEKNSESLKEVIQLSLKENRFKTPLRKTLRIHEVYDKEVCFFDEQDLLAVEPAPADAEEVEEDEYADYIDDMGSDEDEDDDDDDAQDKADNEASSQHKFWSKYERLRLIEGIQAEAKRMLSIEHVERNEAWRVWEVDKLPSNKLESFPVTRFDWNRISSIYVLTRNPKECLIQWTIQEHPSINKKPWTNKESAQLIEIVENIGHRSGQWERIASELGTNRTIAQCFSHYMCKKNSDATKSLKWTKAEDKKLKDAVKVYGNCNWQQVASILKGRTGQQCLHRWSKTLNPSIKRQKWTEEERKLLKRAVQLYGEGNWRKVQRLVPGRTDVQCRERYVNIENANVNSSTFSAEELEKLTKLVEMHGRQWSFIAQEFGGGRTDNFLMRQYDKMIKNQNREEDTSNGPPAKKQKTSNAPKKPKTPAAPKATKEPKARKPRKNSKTTTTKKATTPDKAATTSTRATRVVRSTSKPTTETTTDADTNVSQSSIIPVTETTTSQPTANNPATTDIVDTTSKRVSRAMRTTNKPVTETATTTQLTANTATTTDEPSTISKRVKRARSAIEAATTPQPIANTDATTDESSTTSKRVKRAKRTATAAAITAQPTTATATTIDETATPKRVKRAKRSATETTQPTATRRSTRISKKAA